MLGANLYNLLNNFPIANWLKILDIGENNPLYKCFLQIFLIRSSTKLILSLLYNIGHGLAGMATSNIIKQLIYNTPAKMGI